MSETAPLPLTPDTEVAPLPEDISEVKAGEIGTPTADTETSQEETATRAERLQKIGKTVGHTALKAAKVVGKGSKFAGKKAIVASKHTAHAAGVGAKFAAKKTGELARAGASKAQELKENHNVRVERKRKFYQDMGEVALKLANGEKVDKEDMPKPHNIKQKLGAKKIVRGAQQDALRDAGRNIAVEKKARELSTREIVYGTQDNLYSPNVIKATLLKRAEIQKIKKDFDEGKMDARAYVAEKKRIKDLHLGDLFVEGGKTLTKIEKVKDEPVEAATDTPEPASAIEETSAPTPTPARMSSLERLRKMREDGLLPEASATHKPEPQPVETEPTAPDAPATAEKEELNSTEKMAEIAYITAKDEVFRLIDQEDQERAKTGKSALTKEEKAEIWKKERSIRQGLLQSLTPENRKLVNEQIGKLIEEDREARKQGQEQLRDRRRREAREAESKKREDAKEAKRKADADKKEREKKAAAAVARNAAQTAIDS